MKIKSRWTFGAIMLLVSMFSLNAMANKLDYETLTLGNMTQQKLESLLKSSHCQWRIEQDYHNPKLKHHRIQGGCFKGLSSDEMVDVTFDSQGVVNKKGIIYFSPDSKKAANIKSKLRKNLGEPQIGMWQNTPIWQWKREGYITTLMSANNAMALFEVLTTSRVETEGAAVKTDDIERIISFDAPLSGDQARKIRVLVSIFDKDRKTKPSYKQKIIGENNYTKSVMYTESWREGHGLPKKSFDRLFTSPDVLGEMFLEKMNIKSLKPLIPQAVCSEESSQSQFKITCRFSSETYAFGIYNEKEIPTAQKNALREFIIVLDNDKVLPRF